MWRQRYGPLTAPGATTFSTRRESNSTASSVVAKSRGSSRRRLPCGIESSGTPPDRSFPRRGHVPHGGGSTSQVDTWIRFEKGVDSGHRWFGPSCRRWRSSSASPSQGPTDARTSSMTRQACVTLHRLMFDRMTNHHGLNNMLWVWNFAMDDDKTPEDRPTLRCSDLHH